MAGLPNRAYRKAATLTRYTPTAQERCQTLNWRLEMPETKNDFHRSLDGIVGARTREATRQVNFRLQHQMIGAITKRP